MEADSGLVLATDAIEEWTVEESCRPHLCHLHRRLTVTAPSGETMVVVVAPDEGDGKPAAVGLRSKGWDDALMPLAVASKVAGWISPGEGKNRGSRKEGFDLFNRGM